MDFDTPISILTVEIENLEIEISSIQSQVEMSKARAHEGIASYSPVWMGKAHTALRFKKIDLKKKVSKRLRLVSDRNTIRKMENEKLSEKRNKTFLPILKKLIVDEFGIEKALELFEKAGEIANELT